MVEPPSLAEILERHKAFWGCATVDRPLIGWVRWPANPILDFDWGFPEGEGELRPEMIEVGRLLPQFEAYFEKGPGLLDGDLFWPCLPTRSLPWVEAILGSRVHYSNTPTSKGLFSEPIVSNWSHPPEVPPLDGNLWFEKLTEFVAALTGLSGGRFPIAAPQARGPWDVIGAARGMTELFLDMYDAPGTIMTFAERCAELWIELTRRLEDQIPRWHGGHVSFWGIWAPAYAPMAQNDTSVSVSARQYEEIMRPADLLTAAPWSHYMFHTHSGGAHLIDSMLGFLEAGRALNVVLDPNGPRLPELLRVLRRVQERRVPLHLLGFNWADLDFLASNLSPIGLAMTCSNEGGPRPETGSQADRSAPEGTY
jgi:hypothetical protein